MSGERAGRALIIQVVVLAILVTALIVWVDVRAVFARIATLSPVTLAAALALALASRFVMGYKWRQLIVAAGGRLGLARAVSVYFQSAFSSRLVSTGLGGDVLRAWLVGRSGVPGGIVLGSIAVEKLIALTTNVAFALLGAVYLLESTRAGDQGVLAWLILAGVIASGLGVATLVLLPQVFRRASLPAWVPARAAGLAVRTLDALTGYRSRPAALAVNFILAAVELLVQLLRLYIIGRALGIDLPAAEFVAALMVVLFARRAAGYVEAMGLAEGVSVIALTFLGIAPETAVALAVTNYAVVTVAVLPGAYLLWRNRPRGGRHRTHPGADAGPGTA
ncbi:MAG TPA: lysylphosphatidylglycerol synthase transmembrane domain-containing protein [Longimicrobiales bacterium]|nr:lysylphosphatidylglycerol synthase transmembrane domain-containing protein [Longimicrobiales bacterium]